jgi:DNA repair exonuclease SbcCD ATPase subunit
VSDFAFLVHRLLYLPESRRLLAWDTEAQLRILIILNQDLAPERTFDLRRKSLQLLDSKKRHARVAINKADKELATLMEFDESLVDDDEMADEVSKITDEDTAALASAMRDLQMIGAERARSEREAESTSAVLSTISGETEVLQERIDQEESSLILHLLGEQERDRTLALQKLIDLGICPACGTAQAGLQALALEHLRHHGCAICGTAMPTDEGGGLNTLRSRLTEKLAAQQSLQDARAGTQPSSTPSIRRERRPAPRKRASILATRSSTR